MVHGSPLAINDFLWESLDDEELALRVRASGSQLLLCTHTGIAWTRDVDGTRIVNVGAIGRPANDGRTEVWYAVIDLAGGLRAVTGAGEQDRPARPGGGLGVERGQEALDAGVEGALVDGRDAAVAEPVGLPYVPVASSTTSAWAIASRPSA